MREDDHGPVQVAIPVHEGSEVDLMRALEHVVRHVRNMPLSAPMDDAAVARAVDWLHAKYGNRRTPPGEGMTGGTQWRA